MLQHPGCIVTLRLGSSRPRFLLEYERSPKTSRQYDGIRKTTDRETQVDEILYLVANDHLQWFLMQCFAQTRRRLYIGRASEFLLKLLENPGVEPATGRQMKFGETL